MSESESFWTMIGSLATACALLVALLAFFSELRSARHERDRQEAQELRQNLQRVVYASHSLSALLRKGDPIIFGASTIAGEFGNGLGPAATPNDFWNALNCDGGIFLLAAVKGWDSSPETAKLDQLLDRQEEALLTLNGQLILVAHAGTMLSKIVDDAYSPVMFCKVSALLSDPKLSFFERNKNEQNVRKLIQQLASALMGDTSAYFAARYLKAVEQLGQFIRTCSSSLMNLDDPTLVRVSRADRGGSTLAPTQVT